MRWCGWILLAAACSGGKDTDTGPAPTGETGTTASTGPATMLLTFDLDPDLIPAMEEPALGVFRGSVFAEADASAIGPIEGAVPLLDFTSDEIDFGTTGGPIEGKATLGPIDPQIVWILGCFDSDDNDCECRDPITIPNENKVQVLSGEGTYTVTMSLLNPC